MCQANTLQHTLASALGRAWAISSAPTVPKPCLRTEGQAHERLAHVAVTAQPARTNRHPVGAGFAAGVCGCCGNGRCRLHCRCCAPVRHNALAWPNKPRSDASSCNNKPNSCASKRPHQPRASGAKLAKPWPASFGRPSQASTAKANVSPWTSKRSARRALAELLAQGPQPSPCPSARGAHTSQTRRFGSGQLVFALPIKP